MDIVHVYSFKKNKWDFLICRYKKNRITLKRVKWTKHLAAPRDPIDLKAYLTISPFQAQRVFANTTDNSIEFYILDLKRLIILEKRSHRWPWNVMDNTFPFGEISGRVALVSLLYLFHRLARSTQWRLEHFISGSQILCLKKKNINLSKIRSRPLSKCERVIGA